MYEFLDRLVTIAIPRIRDFRGISGAILRRARQLQPGREGADHFPEIEYDKIDALRGLNISITTDCEDRRGGQGAARGLQLPVQRTEDRHGQDRT